MTVLPEVERAILDAVRRDHAARGPTRRRRIPRRAALLAAAFLVLTASGFAASHFSNVESAVTHGEHPAAPAVNLPSVIGRRDISLGAYRGQIVVLSFWASWCAPCRAEVPELVAVDRLLHQGHLGTVLIDDVYDSPRRGRREVTRLLPGIPAVRDPRTPGSARPFGVDGLPTTFVIDRQGLVTGFERGELQANHAALMAALIRRAAAGR